MKDKGAIAGVIWSGSGKIATKIVAFGFSVFLARLLSPADFGLCGMVAIFIALAQRFTDCGFPAALVRKADRDENDYATVFWFELALGAGLGAALFIAAPTIAKFLCAAREAEAGTLAAVTRALAANIALGALAAVPYTRLQVALRFRAISVVDTVTMIASSSIGLALAWRGAGVWAIVAQTVAWNAIRTALLFGAARWRPRFAFAGASFREFFAFGWKQLGAGLVNTAYSNLHGMLIGRAFGPAETGFYNRAHYYTNEPGWVVQSTFSEVSYPSLVESARDRRALRRKFLGFAGAEALVMFLGLGVFAIFAREIVGFLVGDGWLDCVPCIRALALGAAVEPLRALAVTPLMVDGRSDLILRLEIVESIIGVALVFVALPYGILAICWAKTAYHFIGFAINGGLAWKRFR